MSIISYAQNGEDIVLSRALANVSKGFYIDVGAQDPTIDSVTRLFYEREWSGVNIEPIRHWHARLEQQRPRDINLCIAAGDHVGEISLIEVVDTGLSTTVPEVANRHVAAGRQVVERRVALTTLDDVCAAHGIEQVHFLKVDVEGAEASVLRGISLDRVRPWIILVEATQPNTQVPSHEGWESLLTGRGYQFVYADGLNRFYLANEQEQLRLSFAIPPNCFDDFITYREQVGRDYANDLESKLKILHAQAAELREQLGDSHAQNERVQAALDRVVAERADLLAQMEAVRSAAENRQARIEEIQAAFDRIVTEHEAVSVRSEIFRAAAEERAVRIEGLAAELVRSTAESVRLRSDLHLLLETAQNRQARIVELQADCAAIGAEAHVARLELAQRDAALAAILSSHSWRLTRPLRVLRRIGGGLLRWGLARPLRAIGRRLLGVAWIHGAAHRALGPHPAVRARLGIFLFGRGPVEQLAEQAAVEAAAGRVDTPLSVREREVLSIFKQAGRSRESMRETK